MDITKQELELLEGVKNADEWNAACDTIKRARNGAYPGDWWPKVKMSGMMDKIFARFGGSTEIKVMFK